MADLDLSDIWAEVRRLQNRCTELEATVDELERQVDDQQRTLDELPRDVASANDLENLESRVNDLEDNLD